MEDNRNHKFVLVRPMFAGNVGSVARIMMNFGLNEMRLVKPSADYLGAEGRKMAVSAVDILRESKTYDTVSDAVADAGVVVGTSSGRQRGYEAQPLRKVFFDLARLERNNTVAWLFGNEQNGLEVEELERCHYIATVPTSSQFPALNLAQAACIAAYEISNLGQYSLDRPTAISAPATRAPDRGEESTSALDSESALDSALALSTGAEDDELIELVGNLIDKVEFSRTFNREKVLRELRRVYQRLLPNKRESAIIKGVILRTLKKLPR